jgi:GNAT superfamily N-acetyltransferase
MNSIALIYCNRDHQKQEERRRLQIQFGDMDTVSEKLPKSRVHQFMSAIKSKFEMFTDNSGTIDDEVYFHFEDRFDFPDDQWNQYMVLLRSVYVQEKHRRTWLAKEVLARAVAASDETGCCIIGLVRPFEILLPDGKEARELFTSATFCVYPESLGKRARMMARFRSAGFRRLSVADLDGCDVDDSAAFIYVPESVDVDFKEIITKRLVA